MDFRHLVSFVALVEELHFGRAAIRLNLSQPSLTAQLQKLEKSLAVTLVVRNSHGVRLTVAGAEFATQARAILAQTEKAVDITRSIEAGTSGALNVSYNFPASRHWAPHRVVRPSRIRVRRIVSGRATDEPDDRRHRDARRRTVGSGGQRSRPARDRRRTCRIRLHYPHPRCPTRADDLITGQNPNSSSAAATALVELLEKATTTR